MPAATPSGVLVATAALWTLIVGASAAWNSVNDREQIMERAVAEARAGANKDRAILRWATRRGDVYVPVGATQQPVEWLAHVPGRDVATTDGRALTLLNPASVLRQVMDAYAAEHGVRGRITGLRFLNPANAPDDWERAQIEMFARSGRTEVWEVTEHLGQPALRYLRAMVMEPGCDRCHAVLGYKTGDLRGATGLNLPLDAYRRQIDQAVLGEAASHGAIWLAGLGGIGWAGRSLRRREAAIHAEAARYRTLFEQSREGIVITGLHDPRIVDFNAAACAQLGYERDEFARLTLAGLELSVSRDEADRRAGALAARGHDDFETRFRAKGGAPRHVTVAVRTMLIGGQTVLKTSFLDVTRQKRSEDELRQSEKRFRDIAQVSSDWIWEVDATGRYTYASDSVHDLLGYRPDEILGRTAFELMPPDEAERVGAEFGRIVAAREVFRNLENIVLGKDGTPHITLTSGSPILDESGALIGYRGVDRDVSDERAMAEQVRQLAYNDGLTRLPNRRLLADRLEVALAACRRHQDQGALMFLDLDNFKPLNDRHGHDAGDLLLIEAAARLKGCVREIDTVARFGGDEFVVLLSELQGGAAEPAERARVVAEKVCAALSQPYHLRLRQHGGPELEIEHRCTVSIGVVVFAGEPGVTQDEVIKQADSAMYEAKAAGRNSIQFHRAHAG